MRGHCGIAELIFSEPAGGVTHYDNNVHIICYNLEKGCNKTPLRNAILVKGGESMIKDITIGQFFPGKSPIHKLDARTKIILNTREVNIFRKISINTF